MGYIVSSSESLLVTVNNLHVDASRRVSIDATIWVDSGLTLAPASMTNSLGLWKVRIPYPGIEDSFIHLIRRSRRPNALKYAGPLLGDAYPIDMWPQTVYNAIKAGYRLLDGAGDYGNEKEAGQGVRRALSDGVVKREELCA